MEKKCIKRSVLNAKRNAKCHSSLMAADQYTAENVTLREHLQEETDTRSSQQLYSKINFLPVSIFFFQVTLSIVPLREKLPLVC